MSAAVLGAAALLGVVILGAGRRAGGGRMTPNPGRLGRWAWGRTSLERRATLAEPLRAAVDLMLEGSDVDLTIVSGQRTNAEQAALYAQGRTAPGGIVTYKRPGESKHNAEPLSLAVDLAPLPGGKLSWAEADYKRFGPLVDKAQAELLERGLLLPGETLSWGGRWTNFKDWPHVELRGGRWK